MTDRSSRPPILDTEIGEFSPPPRILLGPGPSLVHPRVLRAMSVPLLGHLDPMFLTLMTDIQQLLRYTFRTTNTLTMAVSGTGSAGMEASVVNLVEPGDTVIVGINGVFGSRLAAMVERCRGTVIRIEAPWGSIIEPEQVRKAFDQSGPVKALALVHAETSTGARQPLQEFGAMCRRQDCLFIVDAVTSLGGMPLEIDGWNIDVCYSGTQKCLSCPPGLAPLTLNDRALAAIRTRRTPCQSWYLDLSLVADYWTEGKRVYHHTAPISMLYGLRESLRLVQEEGLETRFARHRLHSQALLAGLALFGLTPLPPDGFRLPTLNCVTVPSSLDEGAVRQELLREHGIEIGGGLGPLQGTVWRIGLMGESATKTNVLTLLSALEEIFISRGLAVEPGSSLQAASQSYMSSVQTTRP
ncbi:MAG: pyridoxal-phosphate-dependent aminotransferase family protein [Nitrospiraceae bacterium]